jgi:hypothetical protein
MQVALEQLCLDFCLSMLPVPRSDEALLPSTCMLCSALIAMLI